MSNLAFNEFMNYFEKNNDELASIFLSKEFGIEIGIVREKIMPYFRSIYDNKNNNMIEDIYEHGYNDGYQSCHEMCKSQVEYLDYKERDYQISLKDYLNTL